LFNDNFEFNVLNKKRDINGNYLITDVIVEKLRFTFVYLCRGRDRMVVGFTTDAVSSNLDQGEVYIV
jgi:hypothetical protein